MIIDKIDPELADDRSAEDTEITPVSLPDYDPSDFELAKDFEYVEEEDGEEDGS